VAMDMWPAYMSAARQCMPQANIVHDKFHVSKYLGEAVDAARRQEHRKLSQAGTSPLKGSKWAWLKKYPDGRSAEAVSFRALNQLNLKTCRAWRIKGNFSQFWSCSYKGAAKRFFQA
jgi:transposase